MSSLHVLVIGGGPGGLCLAHALKKAGASLGVYERDRAPTSRVQGYRPAAKPCTLAFPNIFTRRSLTAAAFPPAR
jgi:2-polyprenyl-6-methoxyphenol hydroxylase-like FAD-dependent oxidoreductase